MTISSRSFHRLDAIALTAQIDREALTLTGAPLKELVRLSKDRTSMLEHGM